MSVQELKLLKLQEQSQCRLARTQINPCDMAVWELIGCLTSQRTHTNNTTVRDAPKSIAQIPVPVPTSIARVGLFRGAKNSLFAKVMRKR